MGKRRRVVRIEFSKDPDGNLAGPSVMAIVKSGNIMSDFIMFRIDTGADKTLMPISALGDIEVSKVERMHTMLANGDPIDLPSIDCSILIKGLDQEIEIPGGALVADKRSVGLLGMDVLSMSTMILCDGQGFLIF